MGIDFRQFYWQAIGSVIGIVAGLCAITISLYYKSKSVDIVPLPLVKVHNFLLLLYGITVLITSICIFVKPKLWNAGVGIGSIVLVTISILNQLLLAFVDTSFLFARVDRDANGFTRYTAYITNHREALPDRDFYPAPTSCTSPSIAFSPDGKTIACGNKDGTITLWGSNGEPIGKPFLHGHEGPINSIAFSPNGKYVVSGGQDGTVRLWNCQGQSIGEPFRGHTGQVYSVAFSPNGKYIASGGHDGTVRLWNREGIAIRTPFYGHESSVTVVTFSPDGDLIASGSADSTIRMWDLDGNPLSKPLEGLNFVTSIAFSPDGSLIAGAGERGSYAMLWDCQGNPIAQMHIFLVKRWAIVFLAFSPDGKTIVTANRDGDLHLWDLNGNLIGNEISGNGRTITSIAFSPDGQIIASACSDNHIYLWSINGELVEKISQEIQADDKGSKSHFYRSLGYPLVLSAFMRLTGQYNSVAATICQPIILTIVIILCMLWAWRRFGLLYAIALAIPFLDPSNELVRISTYDYADPLLCILSLAVILLAYKVILSDKNTKYYFLIWLALTFIAVSLKVIMCIILLIVCFSLFFVFCIVKISNVEQFKQYSLAVTSTKLVILALSAIVVAKIHTFLAPGAAIFNKQAGLINCYWIPAPANSDPLMKKIRILQEFSDEKYGHPTKAYAGSGLLYAVNAHPPILEVLPILSRRPIPFIDPNNKQAVELTVEEFEQGAYSLVASNPFPLIRFGIEHGLKDYKNMFLFSSIAKKRDLWATVFTIFLLVGIFSLCRYNSLVTISLCVAYILFLGFICVAVAAATRYVLPFIGFYYIAFVCGAVHTINGIKRLLILFR